MMGTNGFRQKCVTKEQKLKKIKEKKRQQKKKTTKRRRRRREKEDKHEIKRQNK